MIVESINSIFLKYLKYDPKLCRWYLLLIEKYRKLYNKLKSICEIDSSAYDLKNAFGAECQKNFLPIIVKEQKEEYEFRVLLSFDRWFQKVYKLLMNPQRNKKNLKKFGGLPPRIEISKESWIRVFQLSLSNAVRGPKSVSNQGEIENASSFKTGAEMYPIKEFQLSLKYVCEPYVCSVIGIPRFVSKTERIVRSRHCKSIYPSKRSINKVDNPILVERIKPNTDFLNRFDDLIKEIDQCNTNNIIQLKDIYDPNFVLECIEECNVRSDKITKNVLFNVYERRLKSPDQACNFTDVNLNIYSNEFLRYRVPNKSNDELGMCETNIGSEIASEEGKQPESVLNAAQIIEALKKDGFDLKSHSTNQEIFSAVFECKLLSKTLTVDIDMEKSTISIKTNQYRYATNLTFSEFLDIIKKEIEKELKRRSTSNPRLSL